MPEAPPKKINPSKFMGASFAAGSKLEEKVENNSKKITLLKNIISLRKKNIDEKIESLKPEETDDNTELMNGLHSVIESLVGVKKVLLDQVKGRIAERKNLRLQNERQSKKRREDELEKGKDGDDEKEPKNIVKAATGVFDRIKKFLTNVLLGAAAIKLFEWFKNPDNKEKLVAFGEFLENHGGKIVAGLIAITALNIIGSLVGIGLAIKGIVGFLAVNPVIAGILGAAILTSPLMDGASASDQAAIRVLESEYGGDKEKMVADLELAKSDDEMAQKFVDLGVLKGMQKGFGARSAEIDDIITMVDKGKSAQYGSQPSKALWNPQYTFGEKGPLFDFKSNKEKEKVFQKDLDIFVKGGGTKEQLTKLYQIELLDVRSSFSDPFGYRAGEIMMMINYINEGKYRKLKNQEAAQYIPTIPKDVQVEHSKWKKFENNHAVPVRSNGVWNTQLDPRSADYQSYLKDEGKVLVAQRPISKSTGILGPISSDINEMVNTKGYKPNTKSKLIDSKSYSTNKKVSGRFDIKTGKAYINDQEVSTDEYEKFANMSMVEKVSQYGIDKSNNNLNIDKSNNTSVKGSDGIESKVSSNKTPKINLLPLTANNESGPTSGSGAFGNDSVIFSSEDPNGTGSEFAVAGIYNVTST